MSALHCCELLAKSQVFQKQASTSAEESKNRAKKKSHGIDHAGGGIAFRLWTATSHPVEIKGGQNFGERQRGIPYERPIAFARKLRHRYMGPGSSFRGQTAPQGPLGERPGPSTKRGDP